MKRLIWCAHHDTDATIQLQRFKAGKVQELHHVKIAGTLTAAAVIGVFSWPSTQETYWLAVGLWYSSLMSSFFSLVSSVHQRLLDAIPDVDDVSDTSVLQMGLKVALWELPPKHSACKNPPGCRKPTTKELGEVKLTWRNLFMIFLWQSSLMQMSWSCVTFLVGLALHVLQVFLPERPAHADEKVGLLPGVFQCTS
ncbi:uncharacterized protein LTR77_006479 [Saxophila tyrrhenica]|uniref:Uncharacterized protein n=1 Tax=Saxophila tyrrhenica TaxID=1690608 RepID=A0AAV9P8L7_9PEZI|nr:hypothetical protein LTR77_006479 [Saxophila tyrrhenica]